MSAETQIANLLYRYAECMDSGDFAGPARLRVSPDPDGTIDAATLLAIWTSGVMRYPDCTPRTKHVVTNPIIQIDETASTASCRSYYMVIQQTDDFGPQIIVTGRYPDQFQRVDDQWRYCFRDYSLMDMVGAVSHHLTGPLAQARGTA